jgi:hypothetical protein
MKNKNKEEWLKVEFNNFRPEEIEDKYIKVILRPLVVFAPAGAQLHLKIQDRDELFKGVLEIKSSQKNFLSICYDKEIYSLVDKLKKDMNWQIDAWRGAVRLQLAI